MKPDAIDLIAQKARSTRFIGHFDLSPCQNVCQMDAATGLCGGCLRTLQEIATWGSMGTEGRRAVWDRIAQRAERLRAEPSFAERAAP